MFYILNVRSFSILQHGWQLCDSLGNFFFLSSFPGFLGFEKLLHLAPLPPIFRICCLPINKGSMYLWGTLFFLLLSSQPLAGHCWALCECLGCLVNGDTSQSSCSTSYLQQIIVMNSQSDLKAFLTLLFYLQASTYYSHTLT